MQKGVYFKTASSSIIDMKKNLVVFLPDLLFFIFTLVLAVLFLYINNLTSIFVGLDLFTNEIRNIINNTSLSIRLVTSLVFLLLINLLVGLSAISTRYFLLNNLIKKEKLNLVKAYKESYKYFSSIIGIKLIILGVYLIPLIILLSIGIIYKPLLILMIILLIFVWIIFKFVFLFVYASLFLKVNKGSIRSVKESIDYFNKNKKHVILTGLFVFVVVFFVSLVFSFIPNYLTAADQSFLVFTPIVVIYTIIKALIDIVLLIWSSLFI